MRFRLRAVETREIDIQVGAANSGFVVVAEGGSKKARYSPGKERATSKRRELEGSVVIVFIASDGLKLNLRRHDINWTDNYRLTASLRLILSLSTDFGNIIFSTQRRRCASTSDIIHRTSWIDPGRSEGAVRSGNWARAKV